MITITHPSVTEGTIEASGLTFVDGKAEVAQFDDAARAVLTDHGFTFVGDAEPDATLTISEHTPESHPESTGDENTGATADETESESVEIEAQKVEDLTRAEIDALAAERGIDTTGAKNKADAIAIIEASPLVPVVGDAEPDETQTPSV